MFLYIILSQIRYSEESNTGEPLMTITTYSPEAYLELEEQSTERHEYCDGEITLMTGGTTNHNILSGKLYSRLLSALEEQDYQIYMADVRLWIPEYRQYTYPDVMVVAGSPVYQPPGTTTVTNPLLIAEVLSPSTQSRDRGEKFLYYRSLGSLAEYILIEQESFFVEQFSKTPTGQWLLQEYTTPTAILKLASLPLEISVQDLYKRVVFSET
jgi:Uma2 family endonuclease